MIERDNIRPVKIESCTLWSCQSAYRAM